MMPPRLAFTTLWVAGLTLSWASTPVPLKTDRPVDVGRLRADNPAVFPLTGPWKFQLTRGEVVDGVYVPARPEEDDFTRPDLNDLKWETLTVPGNWEMAGYSRPTYNDPDNAVGLYRRTVNVPANFQGQRVKWHFDGVFAGAEIWVNRQKVGYHENGYGAFELDVTPYIKPGQPNLLALRVSKKVTSSPLDSGDYWALGGIFRETYLVAVPKLSVDDIVLHTDLDAKYEDAELRSEVVVRGTPGEAFVLSRKLYRQDGSLNPTEEVTQAGTVGPDGTTVVRLAQTVVRPKLWSAEKPNLYYAVFALQTENRIIERVQERFGFREIEIRNGTVLWNGVPIKALGTCRHEEWSALGHALDEKAWQTDIAMIKAANINAIRFSHYNHARRFLELCEEKGMYVLDEAAGCWADMKSEKLKPGMVLRAQEMYARDKNSPAVLAWSIGNESGVGPVNLAAFQWIKAKDPSRPAFISWVSKWADPKIDFDDRHYPNAAEMIRLLGNDDRKTMPLLLSEQPHTYYGREPFLYDPGFHEAWVIGLRNIWDVMWRRDEMFGAFVWEWQDQGLLDKFPGNEDRDPVTGLRLNNEKGIVDGFRRPKGEVYDLKMVYAPIVVPTTEVAPSDTLTIPLVNRYAFTNLNELSCRWQALRGDHILRQGARRIDLAPRSSGSTQFDRVPDMDTLRMEFVHPDGRVVNAVRVHVKGRYVPPAPKPVASPFAASPDVAEDAATVTVRQGPMAVRFNRATGWIDQWTVNGRPFVLSGPALNLGERRPPGGPIEAPNFLYSAQSLRLRQPSVTARREAERQVVEVVADVTRVESPDVLGRLTYTLTFSPRGVISVDWSLDWTSADINAWELGMKFDLPGTASQVEWHRDAAWTEYPAGHPGRPDGTATADDIAFRSTKRDVRSYIVSGPEPYALQVAGTGRPLHMRARRESGTVTVFASTAVAAPKNHNESTPELDIHLVKGQRYGGSFRLTVVDK